MLFSDKLQKIWLDNTGEGTEILANKFRTAIADELTSGLGRGPQYDLKAHIIRINNAWKLFVKDKPQYKSTFVESLIKKSAPEVAKKIWPNDYKK